MNDKAFPQNFSILKRIFILITLFIIEMEIVEIALRSYYDGNSLKTSVWAPIMDYRGIFLSFLIVFFPVFLIISAPRLRSHFIYLLQVTRTYKWSHFLLPQIIAYLVFIFLTYVLSKHYLSIIELSGITVSSWAISLIAVAIFAFLSVAPKGFWAYLFQKEKPAFFIAFAFSIIIPIAKSYLMQLWPSMADLTLHFSETLLQLIYGDVFSDLSVKRLGTAEFKVRITQACSGYEGIVLVTAFLALYIWLFRKEFRFPAVLLLFPIGIVVIWIFNVFRITTLIVIGTSFSPEIAIMGFHSNAGWITFIIVSLGLIALLHRIPFFTRVDHKKVTTGSARMANALLVPVVVLLASTLLTSTFSSGFNWLYPLKVLATGAALWYFWNRYHFNEFRITYEPVVIGIFVFLVWLALVPTSAEKTAEFSSHLADVSPIVVAFWLLFRFIGSVITVPLAEELAFRGYLLSRLSGIDPETKVAPSFAWIPFLASSILFGVFHGAWIAGTLAGMGYAIAYYRRGNTGDAVIAHITTNTLLSLYVAITQEWSYW